MYKGPRSLFTVLYPVYIGLLDSIQISLSFVLTKFLIVMPIGYIYRGGTGCLFLFFKHNILYKFSK